MVSDWVVDLKLLNNLFCRNVFFRMVHILMKNVKLLNILLFGVGAQEDLWEFFLEYCRFIEICGNL